MSPDKSLSVLIPTIGRHTLLPLVSEICRDAEISGGVVEESLKIFIALNGKLEFPAQTLPNRCVVLEVSNRPMGVGRAMNKAIDLVPDGLVWTIADDERWHLGKLKRDLDEFATLPTPSLLLPVVQYRDDLDSKVQRRPRIVIQARDETVTEYLYGHLSLLRNPRYISLSGSLAERATWLQYPFGEDHVREDIVQLIRMDQGGVAILHASSQSVSVCTSSARSVQRDPAPEALLWALTYLRGRQRGLFLGSTWPKPFIMSGRPCAVLSMLTLLLVERRLSVAAKCVATPLLAFSAIGAASVFVLLRARRIRALQDFVW